MTYQQRVDEFKLQTPILVAFVQRIAAVGQANGNPDVVTVDMDPSVHRIMVYEKAMLEAVGNHDHYMESLLDLICGDYRPATIDLRVVDGADMQPAMPIENLQPPAQLLH